MIKCGNGFGFLNKTIQFVGITAELLVQKFDGDLAVKPRIFRQINLVHSARTDFGDDAVMTYRFPTF